MFSCSLMQFLAPQETVSLFNRLKIRILVGFPILEPKLLSPGQREARGVASLGPNVKTKHNGVNLMTKKGLVLAGVLAFLFAVPAFAGPSNQPPPSGAILDLAGGAIPSTYTMYSVSFTATNANTVLTFALRNDPGFFALDDVSMVDDTTSSGNLVVNGGFESSLAGWTDTNVYGATFAGYVNTSDNCGGVGGFGPHSGFAEWCDGSTQAYDAIYQSIATNVGNLYTISFWLASVDETNHYPASGNFQDLSTNGLPGTDGNAVDVLVYAQGTLPPPGNTPEPGTLVLLGTGLLGIGGFGRKLFA